MEDAHDECDRYDIDCVILPASKSASRPSSPACAICASTNIHDIFICFAGGSSSPLVLSSSVLLSPSSSWRFLYSFLYFTFRSCSHSCICDGIELSFTLIAILSGVNVRCSWLHLWGLYHLQCIATHWCNGNPTTTVLKGTNCNHCSSRIHLEKLQANCQPPLWGDTATIVDNSWEQFVSTLLIEFRIFALFLTCNALDGFFSWQNLCDLVTCKQNTQASIEHKYIQIWIVWKTGTWCPQWQLWIISYINPSIVGVGFFDKWCLWI